MNGPGIASAFPRPKLDAIGFGKLLQLWGASQGGEPHFGGGHSDGMWRFQLRAGGTTLFVAAPSYEQAMEMMLGRVRRSLVDTMAAVHP